MLEQAQKALFTPAVAPRGQHVDRKEMEIGKGDLEKREPTLLMKTCKRKYFSLKAYK